MSSDHIIVIPLSQGQQAIISAEDADLAQWKWTAFHPGNYFYAGRWETGIKPKSLMLLHRVVLERILGRGLERREICDHINGNTLDNRRENLRLANRAENQWNKKRSSNNKSGYKGVIWSKSKRQWRANIRVNGKVLHLGYFENPEDAHTAYCEAARQYHGEFARFD